MTEADKEELKRQINIMTHFLNGGEVEFCHHGSNEWDLKETIDFVWSVGDYRIKQPELEFDDLCGRLAKFKDNEHSGVIHKCSDSTYAVAGSCVYYSRVDLLNQYWVKGINC